MWDIDLHKILKNYKFVVNYCFAYIIYIYIYLFIYLFINKLIYLINQTYQHKAQLKAFFNKKIITRWKTCRTQVLCLWTLHLQNKLKIKHKKQHTNQSLEFKHKHIMT